MKILFLSDTHAQHRFLNFDKYKNKGIDTIVHSGDYTGSKIGADKEFFDFIHWFSELPFKNKIFCSGNHDSYTFFFNKDAKERCKELGVVYLEDEGVVVDGVKFYGTPWSSIFMNWYYMLTEKQLFLRFNAIDLDTQVLITHTPPYKIADYENGSNLGSPSLRNIIPKLKKLKIHAFGHIHKGRGIICKDNVTFVNAAMDGYDTFPVVEILEE